MNQQTPDNKPQLISTWAELAKVPESPTHRLDINVVNCNGWVRAKDPGSTDCPRYLTTHTFYGSSYARETRALQARGFNIQLANWDEASPRVGDPKLLDALETPETTINRFDDVTPLLTPEERLWAMLHQATQGEYRTGVPRWWWITYHRKAPNLVCLADAFTHYVESVAKRKGNDRS